MRVNPNPLPDLLAALNQSQLESQQAALEISTGKSMNQPSDNPVAAAQLIEINDQTTFNTGYLQTITAVQGQLTLSSSTLNSIGTSIQQAIALGEQGANGTLSAQGRAIIVSQLQGIQSQLVSLANTSFAGNFVFAGTATNTPPYVLDSSAPAGVNYVGNSDINQVSIGSGYKLPVNLPGSQLFSAPGNDVFLAVNNLIQAVQNNSGVPAAITSLTGAGNYVSVQGIFYSNALSQSTSQTTYLNTAGLQIGEQQSAIGGVDIAAAAAEVTQTQTDIQAALDTISKLTQQNTLFNSLQ